MKIEYLQKLDLILKVANEQSNNNIYKLAFGMNGETYTGDFFIEVIDSKATTIEFDKRGRFTRTKVGFKEGNGLFNIHVSDEMDIISAQNQILTSSCAYLQLIKTMFNIDNLELTENVLPYIYNVKGISNNVKLDFIEIDSDAHFDFISLIKENER